ncbi:MAG: peptide deformylase [Crocosphaera sp.]|nr:peptide deformylase [Crocosphaera sp.]
MINSNLEIAQVGNPILRQQAQYVTNISDEKLQQFIDTLLTTAMDAKGVGIAAPQLSQSYRLFIVCSHPNPRYPDAPLMEPTVMINPRLLSHSQERVKGWEGCLSVPGIRGLVPRYQTITVEYLDRYGKLHQQELTDFIARIFQHELDHLNGILFIDRVENKEDLVYNQQEK